MYLTKIHTSRKLSVVCTARMAKCSSLPAKVNNSDLTWQPSKTGSEMTMISSVYLKRLRNQRKHTCLVTHCIVGVTAMWTLKSLSVRHWLSENAKCWTFPLALSNWVAVGSFVHHQEVFTKLSIEQRPSSVRSWPFPLQTHSLKRFL